ncbi:stage II sporulation protein D [Elusimicrobium posterum]|uniref:SpoIID/LytB domain-containing protein n=1 Tax=Elusimicrobium posterum TaxID=3116653 RepID=UPI003C766085
MKKFILFIFVFFLSVNSFALKILIVENKSAQAVNASGGFVITDSATKKKYKLKEGGKFDITVKGGTVKAGSVSSSSGFIIKPSKKTTFTINGNGYTGSLIILPATSTFNIIEETSMEEYLYGVLPYEMSYSWPLEALKAQAVAARTYTAKTLQSPVNKNFDLYSDVRSQVYKGSAKVYDSVKKAVDGTKDQVLKFNGNLFYTYYHANCGGHTDPLPWGGAESKIKPLNGAVCNSCGDSASAKWNRTIPSADIEKFLTKKGLKGSLTSVSTGKKTSNGRATTLTFKTTGGTKSFSCNDFRIAVGSVKFRSCFITGIKKDGKGFNFTGRGFGHGTGMCQDGAKGMANKDKDYKEILSTFYPGSKISKI